MSNKLIYTTSNDLSEPYFVDAGWRVAYYDQSQGATADNVKSTPADHPENPTTIYFRDPFNDPTYQPDPAALDRLIAQYRAATSIDHITSFADILHHEDKYLQSATYGDLYPATWLPSAHEFVPGRNLAKPRISQRAKDILFDLAGRTLDDHWIIQELLDIREELRVYVIAGRILPIATVKSSKSTGAVKVIGDRPLTPAETAFIERAMTKCPLDVVGFDLAILADGQFKLIEANRSPQFKRYTERTGQNLAALIA